MAKNRIQSGVCRAKYWKTKLTLHDARQSPVVLELVERLLQHVLWVDLLHTQQVQHHVVGQVEGAVQGVCWSLHSPIQTVKLETDKNMNAYILKLYSWGSLWVLIMLIFGKGASKAGGLRKFRLQSLFPKLNSEEYFAIVTYETPEPQVFNMFLQDTLGAQHCDSANLQFYINTDPFKSYAATYSYKHKYTCQMKNNKTGLAGFSVRAWSKALMYKWPDDPQRCGWEELSVWNCGGTNINKVGCHTLDS